MSTSLPRHYVELPTAAVTPAIRALCVCVQDLGDGRSLAKVKRAHVPISVDEAGDLVRELPVEIDAIGLSVAYGSRVARVVLDEARLAKATPEELEKLAVEAKLDPKATAADVLEAWHGVRAADDCDCSEPVAPAQAEALLASPHVVVADRAKLAAVACARVVEGEELKP